MFRSILIRKTGFPKMNFERLPASTWRRWDTAISPASFSGMTTSGTAIFISLSVRVDRDGKKTGAAFEARRSMKILREIERKYRLHPAGCAALKLPLLFVKKTS